MTREIHDNEIEEDIREAFRVFDREGHGFITVPGNTALTVEEIKRLLISPNKSLFVTDLTHVLQTLGEKLSPEETQVWSSDH